LNNNFEEQWMRPQRLGEKEFNFWMCFRQLCSNVGQMLSNVDARRQEIGDHHDTSSAPAGAAASSFLDGRPRQLKKRAFDNREFFPIAHLGEKSAEISICFLLSAAMSNQKQSSFILGHLSLVISPWSFVLCHLSFAIGGSGQLLFVSVQWTEELCLRQIFAG